MHHGIVCLPKFPWSAEQLFERGEKALLSLSDGSNCSIPQSPVNCPRMVTAASLSFLPCSVALVKAPCNRSGKPRRLGTSTGDSLTWYMGTHNC